jgi:vacuolar-type H+-ATPase subunit E/Vma4
MVEVQRTLMKSIPELWEIIDGQELIDRLSTELFRSQPIEVVEREPSSRLVCQVSAASATRVELVLAEEDWGARVAIRVNEEGGGEELAGVLERLLDDLGSDQRRRPLPGPERAPASGEEATSARRRARATTRVPGKGVPPRRRDGDELSVRIARRAREHIERAVKAVEHRLGEAEEAMRLEVKEAERVAQARFGNGHRFSPGGESGGELALAQQWLTVEIEAAEERLAKRAAEIFARFEREVGRLQERARRAAAAAASRELDRRWESSIEPLLRKVETRLTATVSGSSGATSSANLFQDDSPWRVKEARATRRSGANSPHTQAKPADRMSEPTSAGGWRRC